MAKRTCSRADCHAPVDLCPELGSAEYPKCHFFSKADAAEPPSKASKKSAAITTIPWTGQWLRPEDLELLGHRGTPKIIGLIGSSGAGKTTYLAMLYSLLFNGKRIDNWEFAGSYTLNGWELQAKTLQVQENGTVRNPDATPSDKDFYSLYHLALRSDGFLHDILFADSSGEVFSKWADNVHDPAAENARWIYEKAQAFLLFVDCEAIINQRGRARRDIVQLAEQVKRGLRSRPVVIVWSKADMAERMRRDCKTVSESVEKSLHDAFPGAVVLEISNYSKTDSDQLCHINNIGVAKSVLDQLAKPQPLRISPVSIPTNDLFLSYRGSDDGK